MAFCGNCGAKIEGDLRFCPECGTPMAAPRQGAQPPQQPQSYQSAQPYQGAQPYQNAQPYQAAQPYQNPQPYPGTQYQPPVQGGQPYRPPVQGGQYQPPVQQYQPPVQGGQYQPPVQGAQPQQGGQSPYGAPVMAGRRNDARDAEENKVMAILAYLGLLVLVPLFAAKDSPFARFHTNQGLVLAIAEIAFGVVYGLISFLVTLIAWQLLFIVSILGLLGLVFLVLMIIGIVNAANGQKKELPVIGRFRILK